MSDEPYGFGERRDSRHHDHNRYSFQQLVYVPLQYLAARRRGTRPSYGAIARWGSDSNQEDQGAPFTEFTSRRRARHLFADFA